MTRLLVPVCLNLLVLRQIVDLSVLATVNVLIISRVLIRNVGIHVLVLVEPVPNAELSVIRRCVSVRPDLLVILSLNALQHNVRQLN